MALARASMRISASVCPGREAPAAPVFIDGEKRMTLRGEGIAREFQDIVENYIESRFGAASGVRAVAEREHG